MGQVVHDRHSPMPMRERNLNGVWTVSDAACFVALDVIECSGASGFELSAVDHEGVNDEDIDDDRDERPERVEGGPAELSMRFRATRTTPRTRAKVDPARGGRPR